MGLLDILNTIQAGGGSNDPRARAAPASQGMSPTAKALLTLLAIYAMKNLRRADAPPTQPAGQGDVARSWVGTGPNKEISQGDLASALGTDTLNALSEETGMDRGALLSGLSQHLPRFVDQLTPDGRLPTEEEADRMV